MNNNTISRIVKFLRTSAAVSAFLLLTGMEACAGTPDDATARHRPFWSNTFFKTAGGASLHFSNARTYQPGYDVTLAFGKNFGHYSSLRLSGTIETYSSGNRGWLGELNLLYGLNVHHFFKRGNDDRIFEFSPFAGIGFDIGRAEFTWSNNANVQAGVELGFKLSPNLYFTLEPTGKYYVHAMTGRKDGPTEFSAGITAGLRYKVHNLSRQSAYQRDSFLMPEENRFISLSFPDNTFYRLGVGMNHQKSTGGNCYRIGPSFELAAGKKITGTHSVILKMAVEKGKNTSRKYNVNSIELDAIYGFDVTSALYGYKYDRIFTVSALIGGGVDFIDINDSWKTNANVQAGADFNIRITDFLSAYLNPTARLYLKDNKENIPDKSMSAAFSTILGLQYTVHHNKYIPDSRFFSGSKEDLVRQAVPERKLDKPTNSFVDNTFITLLSGMNRRDARKREYKTGSHIGFEFGKEINRYHSLSIGLDFENFKCITTSKLVNIYEIDLIHNLNLTNLTHSAKDSRNFFLKTVGGLGLNQNYYDSHIGLSAAVMVGVQTDFCFTPQITLVIRPMVKGYFGEVTEETSENTYGFSAQLSAGLRFNLINKAVHTKYSVGHEVQTHDGMTKYGFNALEFALQKFGSRDRYQFTRTRKYDGSFVHAGYTMERTAYDADAYDWTRCITIGIGKRFWKNHTLLADITTGNMRNSCSSASASSLPFSINVGYHELEAMHMYHLTSVIHGFDYDRRFEFSTIEGIGMNALNDDSHWNVAGNIKLGADLRIRISKALSFYMDPFFKVYSSSITSILTDRYGVDSGWRNYHFSYGATAGLHISLTSRGE